MSESRHRWHGRERGSAAVRVSALASVVITGVVVGLPVALGPSTSGPGGAEPDASATSTAPTPDSPVVASEVGQTRGGANSDTTLLQVRKVLAPADRSAPEGREWFGIRARTCMHPDARASGRVPWSAWVVATESGLSYAGERVPWDDFPPQQYSTSEVAPGECNVGWVLVSVPRGSFREVVAVAFRPFTAGAVQWAV